MAPFGFWFEEEHFIGFHRATSMQFVEVWSVSIPFIIISTINSHEFVALSYGFIKQYLVQNLNLKCNISKWFILKRFPTLILSLLYLLKSLSLSNTPATHMIQRKSLNLYKILMNKSASKEEAKLEFSLPVCLSFAFYNSLVWFMV